MRQVVPQFRAPENTAASSQMGLVVVVVVVARVVKSSHLHPICLRQFGVVKIALVKQLPPTIGDVEDCSTPMRINESDQC